MEHFITLPTNFADYLTIENADLRFTEATDVAERVTGAGVEIHPNMDHAAIFCDPPHLVADGLKRLGYVNGWDARCYPSPVDGCDYINVSAQLSADSPARSEGWFDYVAVVHPVDKSALQHMLSQGYGNPFIHHLTWGLVPPERTTADDFEYANCVVPFMVEKREVIGEAIGDDPGTLIIALPEHVLSHPKFEESLPSWLGDLDEEEYQVESMQGGGFLIQFFVLTGGRIEVALRVDTTQTFNPKSVHKISEDEISAVQDE
ncbi:hypothetical protein C6496_07400 [Candidatus Poribacteria bacterium]|nr:MAG: hypothetical protein C6496_07400 [Candidatus Poribacteria bacterium]